MLASMEFLMTEGLALPTNRHHTVLANSIDLERLHVKESSQTIHKMITSLTQNLIYLSDLERSRLLTL